MSSIKKENELSCEAVYQVCGRVVVRKIGGDTLLVPISGTAAGGRVFPLNESALIVWESVAADGTVHAATEALVDRYALPVGEALEDCKACIGAFLEECLIEEKVS